MLEYSLLFIFCPLKIVQGLIMLKLTNLTIRQLRIVSYHYIKNTQ